MSNMSAEEIVRTMLRIYHNDATGFDFIRVLEQHTGMAFINEPSDPESLCYANSQAVRPEYKTSFTTADLWNYITNHPSQQSTDLKSMLPKNKQQFWQTVFNA